MRPFLTNKGNFEGTEVKFIDDKKRIRQDWSISEMIITPTLQKNQGDRNSLIQLWNKVQIMTFMR